MKTNHLSLARSTASVDAKEEEEEKEKNIFASVTIFCRFATFLY